MEVVNDAGYQCTGYILSIRSARANFNNGPWAHGSAQWIAPEYSSGRAVSVTWIHHHGKPGRGTSTVACTWTSGSLRNFTAVARHHPVPREESVVRRRRSGACEYKPRRGKSWLPTSMLIEGHRSDSVGTHSRTARPRPWLAPGHPTLAHAQVLRRVVLSNTAENM